MVQFLIGLVVGVGLGLWLYHYALGRAGFLGRLAARQAEKKLAKLGKNLVDLETENNDPNLPGRRSKNRLDKYGDERKDS